jgi:hypothetical protein
MLQSTHGRQTAIMPSFIRLAKGSLSNAAGDDFDAFLETAWFKDKDNVKYLAPGLVVTEKMSPLKLNEGGTIRKRENAKVHGVVYDVGESNDVGVHVKLWPLVKIKNAPYATNVPVLKQLCFEYGGLTSLDGDAKGEFYHNKHPCTFVLKDIEGKVKPVLTADQMRDPSSVPITAVAAPARRSVSPGPRVRFQDPGAGPSNRDRNEPRAPVAAVVATARRSVSPGPRVRYQDPGAGPSNRDRNEPRAPVVPPVTPVVSDVVRPAWVDDLFFKVGEGLATSAEIRAKVTQHDADIAQLRADFLAEKAERVRLEAKINTETARLDGRVDAVAAKFAEIDATLQIIVDKVPDFEADVADLKIAVALIKNPGFLQYVVNKLGAIVTMIGTASVANPEVWTTVTRMFGDLQHTVHMQSGSCAMNALGA